MELREVELREVGSFSSPTKNFFKKMGGGVEFRRRMVSIFL